MKCPGKSSFSSITLGNYVIPNPVRDLQMQAIAPLF